MFVFLIELQRTKKMNFFKQRLPERGLQNPRREIGGLQKPDVTGERGGYDVTDGSERRRNRLRSFHKVIFYILFNSLIVAVCFFPMLYNHINKGFTRFLKSLNYNLVPIKQ